MEISYLGNQNSLSSHAGNWYRLSYFSSSRPLNFPMKKKAQTLSALGAHERGPTRAYYLGVTCSVLPPPGGLDINSSSSGCARLGSGVAPSLGVVEKEVAVLIVLVRRHRRYFKQVETKDPASAVVL